MRNFFGNIDDQSIEAFRLTGVGWIFAFFIVGATILAGRWLLGWQMRRIERILAPNRRMGTRRALEGATAARGNRRRRGINRQQLTRPNAKPFARRGARPPGDRSRGAHDPAGLKQEQHHVTRNKTPYVPEVGDDADSICLHGIHLLAASLASGSILSRMRSTGFAGASEARVLDRTEAVTPIMLAVR
ncbi:MAG: hypothetical protein M3Z96_04900 [Pseudomonadota bacterium]|nr:hypothetical protein [Pseudomonadota bacterium]